jgi:hypothetical protein
MSSQDAAYCIRVGVYSLRPRYEIATVAFHEKSILSPVVVFVVGCPRFFQQPVVLAMRVQYGASAHHVARSAEHLGQAAHRDIGVLKNVDVQEVPDGVIDDDRKVVTVGQSSDHCEVWGFQQRVSWKLAEESENPLP